MNFEIYSHRYADIILNSDYSLKQEIERITLDISYSDVMEEFESENKLRSEGGKKKTFKGHQAFINSKFRSAFLDLGWDAEKFVFAGTDENVEQDLKLDFWKRNVGVDVAFNHRSFIGGDLLRLQAAAEVTNIIKVGVYICAKKNFVKKISPKDGSSLVNFERTKWYLNKFYPVLTVPILLIGLHE